MSRNNKEREEVSSVLYDIVVSKLRDKKSLSRDEQWFYLTSILRVSQEEAERIMEKLRSGQANGQSGPGVGI